MSSDIRNEVLKLMDEKERIEQEIGQLTSILDKVTDLFNFIKKKTGYSVHIHTQVVSF